jgi:hypothetical protein
MLETKVRRSAATKNDDPEHQPTTKLQHHQSIATRPGMHSNAATTTASSMKMDEKWTIGGPSSKNVPQPTLNGGGDWMVLGKQLQRMVSLRLQDAEGPYIRCSINHSSQFTQQSSLSLQSPPPLVLIYARSRSRRRRLVSSLTQDVLCCVVQPKHTTTSSGISRRACPRTVLSPPRPWSSWSCRLTDCGGWWCVCRDGHVRTGALDGRPGPGGLQSLRQAGPRLPILRAPG